MRLRIFVGSVALAGTVITVAQLSAGGGRAGGGPSNDTCANHVTILEGVTGFSTIGANTDGPAHVSCQFDGQTYHDIWYDFTAPQDGLLIVSTCNQADYDTDLVIYDGCDCLNLSLLGCNDDAGGCAGFTSEVTVSATQGNCYLVRVGGWQSGDQGTGTITVSIGSPPPPGTGSDVIYTNIGSISNYGPVGGIRAYSLGSHTCNIGDQNLLWLFDGTPGLAMNAYRLHDGLLMQIGMSWVKHACCAAAGSGCGMSCNGQGGNVLGVGCRDVYGSGYNAIQSNLGPRSGINAFSGAFSPIPGGSGNAIFRRLQIAESDLSSTNYPGALYFAEGVYAATDDAQNANWLNNASYKRVTISPSFAMSEAGSMYVTTPAIYAWRDHGNGVDTPDNTVQIVNADVPGEGRFIVGARAGDNGDGTWRYNYAVFNLNSHRSGGSFSVPVPSGATVSNVGFHDVPYHSGEPYDNMDWTSSVGTTSVTWSSPQTYAQNPDSNALRWGTMYNFRFDADSPPTPVTVEIGLFKPGTPVSVIANAVGPTELITTSPADIAGGPGGGPDGCVDGTDLAVLLGGWCSPAGDADPPGDTGDPPCEGCPLGSNLADIAGAGFGPPDGCVDGNDLAKLLGEWCSVAGGNPCGTCGP